MPDILIDKIRIDGGTQPRTEINNEVVADYAERLKAGDDFPPVDLFFDGKDYWLANGFHRYHAARHAGKTKIPFAMHKGTQRDAILFSCGANHTNGLRRTNDDKRRAVLTLLQDPEWSAKSDRWIAETCIVTHPLVAKLRGELAATPEPPNVSTGNVTSCNNGSSATTGKDGKKRRKPVAAKKQKPAAAQAKPEPVAAIVTAELEEESHDPVEPTAEEQCKADNRAIESFCQSLVKFYEEHVPRTVWTSVDGRVDSALSSVRAGCNTLRTAKAVVCPACEGEGCKYCQDHGYLPKVKADQVARVS